MATQKEPENCKDYILNIKDKTIQIPVDNNGYVNITRIVEIFDKEAAGFTGRNSVAKLISFQSQKLNIAIDKFYYVNLKGERHLTGTYIHPVLMNLFATWCSVEYFEEIINLAHEIKEKMDKKIIMEIHKQEIKREPQLNMIRTLVISDNQYQIITREDGYINATQLAKAAGKEFKNWYQLIGTKDLINELSRSAGIPADLLVNKIMTGPNDQRGTYIHPDLAIHFAMWCSPIVAIQVSSWVKELLITGKVELGKEKSREELDNMQKELLLSQNENKKLLDDKNIKEERIKELELEKKKREQDEFIQIEKNIITSLSNIYKSMKLSEFTRLNTVYLIHVKDHTYKFGCTNCIERRFNQHKETYGPNINLIALYRVESGYDFENQFKELLRKIGIYAPSPERRELFITTKEYDISKVITRFYILGMTCSTISKSEYIMGLQETEIKYLKDTLESYKAQNDKLIELACKLNITPNGYINPTITINNNLSNNTKEDSSNNNKPPETQTEQNTVDRSEKTLEDHILDKTIFKCQDCNEILSIEYAATDFGRQSTLCLKCKAKRSYKSAKIAAVKLTESKTLKTCKICKKELPVSDFYNVLQNDCKACRTSMIKQKRREENPTKFTGRDLRKNLLQEGKRYCSKCNEIKTIDNFHKDNHSKQGYASSCKQCQSIFKKNKTLAKNNSKTLIKNSSKPSVKNPNKNP